MLIHPKTIPPAWTDCKHTLIDADASVHTHTETHTQTQKYNHLGIAIELEIIEGQERQ